MRHETTIAYTPDRDRWGWRCTCGAWGQSYVFDEQWVRDRANLHQQHHQEAAA